MSMMLEIKVVLAEEIVRQLHEQARRWGVSEGVVVEQALGMLFAQSDPAPVSDYGFSASTMREDWEEMPDDWYIDEVDNGVPAR